MTDAIAVFVTAPTADKAAELARALVEGLAACGNVVPGSGFTTMYVRPHEGGATVGARHRYLPTEPDAPSRASCQSARNKARSIHVLQGKDCS